MRVYAKFAWDVVSPGPQTSPGLRDKSTSISLSRFARTIFFSTALQLFFFVSRIGKWLNQTLPVLAIIFIAIFWLTGITVSYVFPQYQHHCWTVACKNLEKNFNLWCDYILLYWKCSALFGLNIGSFQLFSEWIRVKDDILENDLRQCVLRGVIDVSRVGATGRKCVNQLMSIILLTISLYSQWLIITYLERSFSEDNAAERSRSWPQAAREDLQICLTSGMFCFFHNLDVARLPAVMARNMHHWSKIAKLTISWQAVVAASAQGEDRKDAPSDDLTPGRIFFFKKNLAKSIWQKTFSRLHERAGDDILHVRPHDED